MLFELRSSVRVSLTAILKSTTKQTTTKQTRLTLITPFAVENVREERMRKRPPLMFWTPSCVFSWPKYSVPKTRPSNWKWIKRRFQLVG